MPRKTNHRKGVKKRNTRGKSLSSKIMKNEMSTKESKERLERFARAILANFDIVCKLSNLNFSEQSKQLEQNLSFKDINLTYVKNLVSSNRDLKNQIEGNIKKGSNIVVIEDLISTGKSSLNAINALKSEGYNVMGMLSIFSYNFHFANKKFKDENISINSLSDYNSLVDLIQSEGTLDSNEISRLKKWREDPKTWS